ncbi:class II aldolase/adducin family protein [Actinacidiphila bryophytorum]|uniref:class II aldolase/adducin family protein n=1 Tax=Actinacidiphila bryophytorum TaxID=1436133 RepID=UPI002176A0CB|nr:class II aldolase/adducin family protein [Actinacidiphila bryophytorum]UWE09074.1 class II aldolase/adducin family protein [Actinacidiphila bryophytorum]
MPEVPDAIEKAWSDVVDAARRTVADGLVVGTSGNVSARVGDIVVVTPTGVPYGDLRPQDAVAVDLDGRQVAGELAPTSELPLHLAVYRGTEAEAIVHTHAPHATAVSTLVDVLPPIHYVTAMLGGAVRVAPYALYGTPELAAAAVAALEDRTACLLANHGTIAYGSSLGQAYERTAQLEWLARVWLLASAAGAPRLLPPADLAAAATRLSTYGQDLRSAR